MARCGRCGLWQSYPVDFKEKAFSGVCLWYQTRLTNQEVYAQRKCPDFVERVPNRSADWHFDHKVKRLSLGQTYREGRVGIAFGIIAIAISLAGLFL